MGHLPFMSRSNALRPAGGSDFLDLAVEGGILDGLVALTESDDFDELAPSRIPGLVSFLMSLLQM
jgi:hypothetical protein